MEHRVKVLYAGGQKEYTIPFPYLAKTFIKATVDGAPLLYGIDYTVEDKHFRLKKNTSETQTLEIYRQTATSRLVDFNDGSVLRGQDLTTFQLQLLHIVEENGLFGTQGGSSGGGSAGGGSSYASLFFPSVRDMQLHKDLKAGDIVKTRGYYSPRTGGGAQYLIKESAKDAYGNMFPWAIPLENGLFALPDEHSSVSYRQFGARLDGTADDAPAMRLCHAYADSHFVYDDKGLTKQYTCKVEQHDGTILKKGSDAIVCASDVDLSGATLIVNDDNATWFGIYVWGDNNSLYYEHEFPDEVKAALKKDTFVFPNAHGDTIPANTVVKLEEDPYAARDDAGYLYTVPRRELLVHDMDGICVSPLTDDWQHAGGEEINCQISDLAHGTVTTAQTFTRFNASYTYLPAVHGTFTGCDVRLDVSAGKYCSVLWCKRHNATVKDFIFRPKQGELHNRRFKNAMIYLWDSYNVRVRNLQGFNAAGKKNGSVNGTSGYMLRITNCSDVHVENCNMQGYWGATAMDSVKNIHFKHCHMNRLDIHDYFSNLYAEECTFYNHAIQIGYGRGVASFTNCIFHYHPIPDDSYPSAHMVEFNLTYGRVFEGLVNIDGCRVICSDPPDNEYNIFKMEFSPDATVITKHFQLPEINCRNCLIESTNPAAHFACFKIAGTRRAATSTQKPTHIYGVVNDGTATWRFFGRGVNWGGDEKNINKGEVLRVFDTFLDKEKKTQFYNIRYYLCTKEGTLSFDTKPTKTDGAEFTCGTATLQYRPNILWQSKYGYQKGDICAVSQSFFYPLYMFECIKAGTSGGTYPTHTSGTELDGKNDSVNEPDGCWWTYIGKKSGFCNDWKASMQVRAGQRFIAEGRIYEVTEEGTLDVYPPYDTAWFGTHKWGTATLKFIGQVWKPRAWFAKDAYCEARGNIYRCAKHDGTTSGIAPTRGNPYCVDGDIIWEYVSGGQAGGSMPPTGSDNPDLKTASDNPPTAPAHIGTLLLDGTLPVKYLGAHKYQWRTAGTTYEAGDMIMDNTFIVQCVKGGKSDENNKWGPVEGAAWSTDDTLKDGEVVWKKLTYSSADGQWRSGGTHYKKGTIYYADQNAQGEYHMYQVVESLTPPPPPAGAQDTWKPRTAYKLGDTVTSNGCTYRCAFDGVLVLPQKTIFENIITNMQGHVFWFYPGTNIPTKQGVRPWEVTVRNCTGLLTTPEGGADYFGRSTNPAPILKTT